MSLPAVTTRFYIAVPDQSRIVATQGRQASNAAQRPWAALVRTLVREWLERWQVGHGPADPWVGDY